MRKMCQMCLITIRIHALICAMYICLCKAVTDKDIHRAVNNGAATMRCLRQQNGVGSQCGRCVGHAKEVLGEALSQHTDNGVHAGSSFNALQTGGAGSSGGGITSHTTGQEPTTIATAPGVGVCYP